MGIDRGGRTDRRQRRAFQKLALDPFGTIGLNAGDGISFDLSDNTINVDLRDTTPGLELAATGIGVIVGNGLELTATGVEIDLAANPGLAFSTGDLTIDLRDTTPGLELVASGIGVIVGNGLELTATGVEIDLAADPGLEFDTGDLRVKVKASGGVVRDADGLSITLANHSLDDLGDVVETTPADGEVLQYDTGNWVNGPIVDSGTYTPTISNTTNVAASTTFQHAWMRIGEWVMVTGFVEIDPTATATFTKFEMDLPFGGSFSSARDANGQIHSNIGDTNALPGAGGYIYANSAAARVVAEYVPESANAKFYVTVFMFRVR